MRASIDRSSSRRSLGFGEDDPPHPTRPSPVKRSSRRNPSPHAPSPSALVTQQKVSPFPVPLPSPNSSVFSKRESQQKRPVPARQTPAIPTKPQQKVGQSVSNPVGDTHGALPTSPRFSSPTTDIHSKTTHKHNFASPLSASSSPSHPHQSNSLKSSPEHSHASSMPHYRSNQVLSPSGLGPKFSKGAVSPPPAVKHTFAEGRRVSQSDALSAKLNLGKRSSVGAGLRSNRTGSSDLEKAPTTPSVTAPPVTITTSPITTPTSPTPLSPSPSSHSSHRHLPKGDRMTRPVSKRLTPTSQTSTSSEVKPKVASVRTKPATQTARPTKPVAVVLGVEKRENKPAAVDRPKGLKKKSSSFDDRADKTHKSPPSQTEKKSTSRLVKPNLRREEVPSPSIGLSHSKEVKRPHMENFGASGNINNIPLDPSSSYLNTNRVTSSGNQRMKDLRSPPTFKTGGGEASILSSDGLKKAISLLPMRSSPKLGVILAESFKQDITPTPTLSEDGDDTCEKGDLELLRPSLFLNAVKVSAALSPKKDTPTEEGGQASNVGFESSRDSLEGETEEEQQAVVDNSEGSISDSSASIREDRKNLVIPLSETAKSSKILAPLTKESLDALLSSESRTLAGGEDTSIGKLTVGGERGRKDITNSNISVAGSSVTPSIGIVSKVDLIDNTTSINKPEKDQLLSNSKADNTDLLNLNKTEFPDALKLSHSVEDTADMKPDWGNGEKDAKNELKKLKHEGIQTRPKFESLLPPSPPPPSLIPKPRHIITVDALPWIEDAGLGREEVIVEVPSTTDLTTPSVADDEETLSPSSHSHWGIEIGEGSFVASTSALKGVIHIGSNCLIHPSVLIDGRKGPVYINDGNVFEEQVVIINTSESAMSIGSYNLFEVGARASGPLTIKDGNIIGPRSILSPRSSIGSGCILGANSSVSNGMSIPNLNAVYGGGGPWKVHELHDTLEEVMEVRKKNLESLRQYYLPLLEKHHANK